MTPSNPETLQHALNVRVVQPNLAGRAQGGAILSVRKLTENDQTTGFESFSKDVAVTVTGQEDAATTIALPSAGLYRLTLRRPRGPVIEEDVPVSALLPTEHTIRLEASTRESLSWETLAGTLPPPFSKVETDHASDPTAPTFDLLEDEMFLLHPVRSSVLPPGVRFLNPLDNVLERPVPRPSTGALKVRFLNQPGDFFGLQENLGTPTHKHARLAVERRGRVREFNAWLPLTFPTELPLGLGGKIIPPNVVLPYGVDQFTMPPRETEGLFPTPQIVSVEFSAVRGDWDTANSEVLLPKQRTSGMVRAYPSSSSWSLSLEDRLAFWSPPLPDVKRSELLITALRSQVMANEEIAGFPRWVGFLTQDHLDVASIPWAWWGVTEDRTKTLREDGDMFQLTYDRLIKRRLEPGSSASLTVTLRDSHWFGLLEFLGSGQLIDARTVMKSINSEFSAESALMRKQDSPLRAVAGAILLINVLAEQREQWDWWLENLASLFPGIPDGSILLGVRRLQLAESPVEIAEALRLLQEGMGRGLPYFSATITMLATALAQLADTTQWAGMLYRIVMRVATHVDPRQPFTVLRFDQ